MPNKNAKIALFVGLGMLPALFVSGCGETNRQVPPDDLKKRIAIMTNKSLTDDQRTDKLSELDASEQPSPSTIPIVIIIGSVAVAFVIRAIKQRQEEIKEEQLQAAKKAQKIAEAKAAYDASKVPRIVSKRIPQAAVDDNAAGSDGLGLAGIEEVPKIKIASSQTAVNALQPSERGLSFFSSRPAPKESLIEMTIEVGGRFRLVWATPEEADAIDIGRIPLVRAFTYRRKTLPWYEWAGYDPYAHYWSAVAHDWLWMGSKITASWMGVERVNPAMPGYGATKTRTKFDWERVTRPSRPDDPKERMLFKCSNMARFLELKRRKFPKPTRSIVRGLDMPPLAIPSRPLRLQKRRVKRVDNERHVFLEF